MAEEISETCDRFERMFDEWVSAPQQKRDWTNSKSDWRRTTRYVNIVYRARERGIGPLPYSITQIDQTHIA
jgi:hypothetical protein